MESGSAKLLEGVTATEDGRPLASGGLKLTWESESQSWFTTRIHML